MINFLFHVCNRFASLRKIWEVSAEFCFNLVTIYFSILSTKK